MKTLLVTLAFVAILGSLGAALFFMMRGESEDSEARKSRPRNMARALALRVALSIVLFLCILVAWKLGYLKPTGIPVGS